MPAANKISVDLLVIVSCQNKLRMDINGLARFTLEQFLAHSQARLNEALNAHVINTDAVSGAETSQNTEVGVGSNLFARTSGTAMTSILDKTQIVEFDYRTMDDSNAVSSEAKFLVHSITVADLN